MTAATIEPGALLADLTAPADRLGAGIAGPAAVAVDRDARFPREAVDALRAERLLSAFVPIELGGMGAGIGDLAAVCEILGRHCSAAAMVFAMHQIEVICLVRHGLRSDWVRAYLGDLVDQQRLIASATSEVGVGGDVRTSLCAVDIAGDRFTLEKQAAVISYGAHADDILATARRAPDAAANDQVLVLLTRDGLTLEPTSEWDTLGFRGTCSPGFRLAASGDAAQILGDPFADISTRTMLPVSHILWASIWLGIAISAVDRARSFVRAEARKRPGVTPPASLRLAELTGVLQMMRANVHDCTREYAAIMDDADALASLGFAIRMNNLKIGSSQLVVQIVSQALLICGMAGYRNEGPYSLGRHLRDSFGALLMINNDRIAGANASMLLVHKGE
jgi:acyl-CoA dehydrogenase